jgi:hypothetical protein
MSLNNITSAELKQLISIVERKERVQEELREIESKLSTHLSPEPATPIVQIGYWGAMEQKSSIRKMSNDFLENVGCAPQRAQLATTYGFWK